MTIQTNRDFSLWPIGPPVDPPEPPPCAHVPDMSTARLSESDRPYAVLEVECGDCMVTGFQDLQPEDMRLSW